MFKKNLAIILSVCLVFGAIAVAGLFGSRAAEQTVTFAFANMGYENGADVTSVTNGGVDLTFAQSSSNNPPKYYTTGSAVRMYPKNTLTVEANQNIKKIEFTFSSNSNTGPLGSDVGTYTSGTWTGEGKKVVFTNNGTSGHARIQKIVVTMGEGSSEPTATPFVGTPEEIVEAVYELENGAELPGGNFTLTGVVTYTKTPYSSQYNDLTVDIVIGDLTDKPIRCYQMVNNSSITPGEGVEVVKLGDTITVTGKLTNYNGIGEFEKGCTLDARVPAEEPVVLYDTPEEIVSAAYELEPGEYLQAGPYSLTGEVISIDDEFSAIYNNVTVTIVVGDMTEKPIKCYRMKNGSAITSGEGVEILSVGDVITVSGEIKNYEKDGVETIEFDTGCTLEEISFANIFSAKLTLSENLNIIFGARINANKFNAEEDELVLKVVLNGKTTEIVGEVDDEDSGKYLFEFNNLTPALMKDEMEVSLLVRTRNSEDPGTKVDETTYSIAEYCYKLLRQTDNASLKTLLVDLLIYGAKSQLYINHNVDNLADADLTEDELDFATPDEDLPNLENVTQIAGKIDEDDAIYSFKSVGLNLTDGIIIRVKLVLNEGKEHSPAASLCINSFIDGLLEETSVPGTYYAYAKVDNPTFFSTGIQLRVVNQGELNPSLSHTLYTSAESYCASILEKCADGRINDQPLQDIVTALVKYAYSVKAYAQIVNN